MSVAILIVIILFMYYSFAKMVLDKKELHSVKEDCNDQDNLDLTNKQ